MEKKQFFTARKLAVFGLMSALVFVSSWMQIPIGDVTRIHLGNGFCALTGLLFGPVLGGLASGMGSMLFDFTNPLYISEAWITFLTKFAIGFVAGAIAHAAGAKGRNKLRNIIAAAAGCFTYVGLYLGKSYIFKYLIEHQDLDAVKVQLVTKLASSTLNAVMGTVIAVLLAAAIRPALVRSGLLRELLD